MAINLLDLLKGYMSNDVIGAAAGFLGEGETQTRAAVDNILPTLLGGLMSKASTSAGANSLINMLNDRTHDGSILTNIMDIFSGGDKSNAFLRMGSSVLGNIFGEKTNGVVDLIASAAGLRRESSANMLSFLAPIVMGLLGKTKKDQGLNASGLLSLILGQGSSIGNLLPAGLGGLLGFSSVDGLLKTAMSNLSGSYKLDGLNFAAPAGGSMTTSSSSSSSSYTSSSNSSSESRGGGMGWLPWLLLPLLLLGAFFAWKSCGSNAGDLAHKAGQEMRQTAEQVGQAAQDAANTAGQAAQGAMNTADSLAQQAGQAAQNAANTAGQAAQGAANQAGQALQALGKFFMRKLPSGVELNIPENGIENKLVQFIEDKTKVVDKETWFDFDRLLFETGKDVLKPESQEQLKNIAEILKAYPVVEVKIGGYTDNSGDPKKNLALSQKRAEKVMSELVKMGIAAKRMKAEGYGDQHPVASNDTPEGREKNRRVSVRVTKK